MTQSTRQQMTLPISIARLEDLPCQGESTVTSLPCPGPISESRPVGGLAQWARDGIITDRRHPLPWDMRQGNVHHQDRWIISGRVHTNFTHGNQRPWWHRIQSRVGRDQMEASLSWTAARVQSSFWSCDRSYHVRDRWTGRRTRIKLAQEERQVPEGLTELTCQNVSRHWSLRLTIIM